MLDFLRTRLVSVLHFCMHTSIRGWGALGKWQGTLSLTENIFHFISEGCYVQSWKIVIDYEKQLLLEYIELASLM